MLNNISYDDNKTDLSSKLSADFLELSSRLTFANWDEFKD
jgi:hypothetical protein